MAPHKDIMMKRDTHEGEQERAASAQWEHGVTAQQEEPENGEHPGASRKGRGGGNRNTIGVIFLPVPQGGRENDTHSALPHTAVLTQRQLCSRGRWEDAARSFKEARRRVSSQEPQTEKRERGSWAVAQVASGFPKCFQVDGLSALESGITRAYLHTPTD